MSRTTLPFTFRVLLLTVADFGLSAIHEQPTWLETHCGTRGYRAPEILTRGAYKGPPADVWSLGVVLFEMLTALRPMRDARQDDWWFARISESNYKAFWSSHLKTSRVSESAQGVCSRSHPLNANWTSCVSLPIGDCIADLLNKIFVVDPTKRATLAEIAEHPWVKGKVMSYVTVLADRTKNTQTYSCPCICLLQIRRHPSRAVPSPG